MNTMNRCLLITFLIISISMYGTEQQKCTLYFIRHGETDWNKEGKLQGHSNIPLNQQGEKQALKLKGLLHHVNFTAAFSSDLMRACKTAEIVLSSQPMSIFQTEALRERCMGIWEGRSMIDLKKNFKEKQSYFDQLSKQEFLAYTWDDKSESYEDVYKRVKYYVGQHAADHLGSSVLVSTHGGVLRALLYSLDFKTGQRWQVSNCAYLKVIVDAQGELSLAESEGIDFVKTENALIPF